MPKRLEQKKVVLDACCTLNLSATGRLEQILRELPFEFLIGRRARTEAQWLENPDSEEREVVTLDPCFAEGLLSEVSLCGEAEEAIFVVLSACMHDGEAEAAAVAASRGWAFATDDRKARRMLGKMHPTLRLSTTQELLFHWYRDAHPSDAEVAEALRRIEERATYRPPRADPLTRWWNDFTLSR